MRALSINGFKWKVHFVPEDHDELCDTNGTPSWNGITLWEKCEIYIDDALPKGLMEKIVTHELVHAIAFSYDIDLDDADEEKICDFIGTYFNKLKSLRKAVLKAL